MNVVVHSAAMQDRDGALLVLNRRTRRFFPFIKFIFADAGYQGQKTAAAIAKTGRGRWSSPGSYQGHRLTRAGSGERALATGVEGLKARPRTRNNAIHGLANAIRKSLLAWST